YKKGNGHAYGKKLPTTQPLNDQIAFYTQVPGYYASPAPAAQSPICLVAYRVNQNTTAGNSSYMKLERLGRGLPRNGADSNSNPTLVFLPVTIGSLFPWAINNNNNCGGNNSSCDPNGYYETIGPGVFRMEYYYVLKNGQATGYPWDTDAGHTS